jgi:hypothetical protein
MDEYTVGRELFNRDQFESDHKRVSFDTRIPLLTLDEAEALRDYLESNSKDYFYIMKPKFKRMFRTNDMN